MFQRVLIANRGAIAVRIIRTLKRMGVESVVVYHEKDRDSLHVQHADIAVDLGDGPVTETYLNQEKLIEIALETKTEAIHPGYGFLSENPSFVEKCEANGLSFIGPTPQQMNVFGLKHLARETAEKADIPIVPGSPVLDSLKAALSWADQISYPVILKSSAGGGGIGMQVCRDEESLTEAWGIVKRLSANYFSNDTLFLEKFIDNARHIEVQIFGDGNGDAVALGERDCSAQRRNQKVIEESPAPNLDQSLREAMHRTAEALMSSVGYRNAGTVEFIFDTDQQNYYFLEVNTRLQVEHGVTEEVFGVDLVEWMLQQAALELPSLESIRPRLQVTGHAIQVRLYAEDTQQNFQPCAGLLSDVSFPDGDGLRIDTWVESGQEVPSLFDPMIAKVIVSKTDRKETLRSLILALQQTRLYGIETNLDYVVSVLATDITKSGRLLTKTLANHQFEAPTIRVLSAGTQTTIQDFPGRQGYWHVGVPPSGPMDNVSFRLANALIGNPHSAAALEITLSGPDLLFMSNTVIALTGAEMNAELDSKPVPRYQTVSVIAGQTLSMSKVSGRGARAYLAIAGGIECPVYLGSKSTFTLGQFGGHGGRALRTGDVLHLGSSVDAKPRKIMPPQISEPTELRVIYGPHGAPDFFTNEDVAVFFAHDWEVHYNSSRSGIRLIGPKPNWARPSGGEAGMHPSNIHDNAYAFGTVDFTGDVPVILGPDGPSLGGFVCPATVITADLWKLGQLATGQKVRFIPVSYEKAVEAEARQSMLLDELQLPVETTDLGQHELSSPIVKEFEWEGEDVVIRLAGDHFLLIELGPQALDIPRRFKVHALMLAIEELGLHGLRELTPGIRSLQIHYDSQSIKLDDLLKNIEQTLISLTTGAFSVPSRIVHLPMSWNDDACKLAIEKYMQSIRADAPWCPSNLEFIRRMNGLDSIDDVKKIVFDASYLVMGLGDVYLGAPVATPVDPRHRLITTKYNPARTWTAENSVGIGGAYLCVYGMEGPGGYQFVGRTGQMWNRYKQTEIFTQPWLLRFFDQVRFYEVTAQELADFRRDLPRGSASVRIKQTKFSLTDYRQWLEKHDASINDFKTMREESFEEELQRWRDTGQFTFDALEKENPAVDTGDLPKGSVAVDSSVSGNVWKIEVQPGQTVAEGETLLILESMKMEIAVTAPQSGVVGKVWVGNGQDVQAGQCLLWLACKGVRKCQMQ
ncbi:MAG: urea carboxylase [Gammaproteobacteria bacterium]|nr:urea carboxylase [Gammaproteobacteria bacterium]